MKNRDCKKWFKIAEITPIAKINVKLQISNKIWIFTCKSAFFTSTLFALILSFKKRGFSCKNPNANRNLGFYIDFRDFR